MLQLWEHIKFDYRLPQKTKCHLQSGENIKEEQCK